MDCTVQGLQRVGHDRATFTHSLTHYVVKASQVAPWQRTCPPMQELQETQAQS